MNCYELTPQNVGGLRVLWVCPDSTTAVTSSTTKEDNNSKKKIATCNNSKTLLGCTHSPNFETVKWFLGPNERLHGT